MSYVTPAQRRINVATALLAAPGPFDPNPIFAQVPQQGWAQHGYQYTLTVQWSNVPVQGLGTITVRAHVHYRWQPPVNPTPGQWTKLGGNAWISDQTTWHTHTPDVVVNMAPANPPDVDYHG